jgi:hypothetical protein
MRIIWVFQCTWAAQKQRFLPIWKIGCGKRSSDGMKEKLLPKAGKEILIKLWLKLYHYTQCLSLILPNPYVMKSILWYIVIGSHNKIKKKIASVVLRYFNHTKEGGLGFRDLHLFDVSMLARQTWRLAAPESLCAQVFRAKCFSNGDLLCAKEGPCMSYTWRSIVSGIKALKEGFDMTLW